MVNDSKPNPRAAPASSRDFPVLALNDAVFTAEQIIQAAFLRGQLQPVWEDFLRRIEIDRRALERGLKPDAAMLQRMFEEFRYARDLITAEENDCWLEQRGLTLDDLNDFFRRQCWTNLFSQNENSGTSPIQPVLEGRRPRRPTAVQPLGTPPSDSEDLVPPDLALAPGEKTDVDGGATPASANFLSAPPELRDSFQAELFISGAFDELAVRLAWRVAAFHEPAPPGGPTSPEAKGGETVGYTGFGLGDLVPPTHVQCPNVGAKRRTAFHESRHQNADEWFETLAQMEAAFSDECARLITPEARSRIFDTLRLGLVSLEIETAEFESLDTARQAASRLQEEGVSIDPSRHSSPLGGERVPACSADMSEGQVEVDSWADTTSENRTRIGAMNWVGTRSTASLIFSSEGPGKSGTEWNPSLPGSWAGRLFLEDLPKEQRSLFLCAVPGQVLGPFAEGHRFRLWKVFLKIEPSLSDPEVQERVEKRMIEEHFSRLVRDRIRWFIPLGRQADLNKGKWFGGTRPGGTRSPESENGAPKPLHVLSASGTSALQDVGPPFHPIHAPDGGTRSPESESGAPKSLHVPLASETSAIQDDGPPFNPVQSTDGGTRSPESESGTTNSVHVLSASGTSALQESGPPKSDSTETSAKPMEDERREPFEDERGLFRKRKKRIRHIPFVQQIDAADCGAACLGMICRHFGRKVSLSRIRQLCHTSTSGTSLKAICHAATELGLAARGLKVSRRNVPHLPLPAILHWDGNHWVVLLEVGETHARVADPATGIQRLPRAEFDKRWSGYAALFDYTAAFEKAPEGKATLAWVWPFFKRFQATLLQVLVLAGVVTLLQLLFPVFTQVVVDKVIVENDVGLLQLIILGLGVSGLFMLGSNLVQQYLLSFATVRIDSAILDYLTRRLLALPLSYFNRRRTGDIQRRLEGAQQVRSFVVRHGIGGVLALVRLLGAVGLMMVYSLKLFGVFLITAPLYGLLMVFSLKILRPLFADLEASHGRYSSHQIDAIKGIEAVKAAAAEPAFRDTMLNEFLIVARKTFRSTFIGMSYESAIQLIGLVSTALFLWVAATMVMGGEITVGGFVAFNTLLAMAYAAVLRALGIWDELQMVVVLLNRLNDIFDQEPEQGRDRSRLRPVRALQGHIELRDVHFRYGGPESPEILKGIDLEVVPGQTVAIVGRSGSGKTTLVKLLAGLLEPTKGTVLFDRVDLKTLNYRDLRQHIGLVLQDNHIFNGTIAQNVSFGDPEADVDRVLKAAQMANAHEFIMALPQGYETKIGESELHLSGGQKQRIAIARAIYNDPPILIFDEATSALDSESERAIQSNLNQLMAGRTSIVIANRLSTIRNASRIVVLDKGQIVESGAHEELMARHGLYYYLISQQLAL